MCLHEIPIKFESRGFYWGFPLSFRTDAMQLEFLRPITASILSERRAVRPFGLEGGGSAATGLNLIVRRDGHTVNMGAKATVNLQVRYLYKTVKGTRMVFR